MAIEGFCIAFDDPWDEPDPTWTRLDGSSGLVASYTIQRGRQDELQKTGTGTATVRLNDTQGDFEPTYIGSPYFDKLDGKQAAIALFNPVTETWSTRFRGFVDGYEYEVDPSGVVTRVEVSLVDGLDYLSGVELSIATAGDTVPPEIADEVDGADIYYTFQQVDDRIKAVLTEAKWPLDLRTIFSGNVIVKSGVYPPATSALQVLSDAADAEFPGVANIYVDAKGYVTFHGRHARFDPDGVSAGAGAAWDFTRWKVGDGSIISTDTSYAQLRRLSFSRQRKNIINRAAALPDRWLEADLTPAQINTNTVDDLTSQGDYGIRSWSAENLLTQSNSTDTTTDLEETKKFADYYLANYATPRTRITQLGFRSIRPDDPRGPAVWALLCGAEISDIAQVATIHPGGGGFEDEQFFIEGLTYDVQPLNGVYADVTLSLDVSPQAYYDVDPFEDA